jgi:hypothetical protein
MTENRTKYCLSKYSLQEYRHWQKRTNRKGQTDQLETSDYINRLMIIEAYRKWLARLEQEGINDDCTYGSLITLMFRQIPGSFDRKCEVMFQEAERVYSTLLPHICRYPHSQRGRSMRPIAVFAPDYRRHKYLPQEIIPDVIPNDGLHLHSYWVVKTDTRLKVPLVTHFDKNLQYYKQYVRPDRPLQRIDVQPVTYNRAFVADYAMKSLKVRIPDLDNILVLPRESPFPLDDKMSPSTV